MAVIHPSSLEDETVEAYTDDGRYCLDGQESDLDLRNSVTKYVNVYFTGKMTGEAVLHNSEAAARRCASANCVTFELSDDGSCKFISKASAE